MKDKKEIAGISTRAHNLEETKKPVEIFEVTNASVVEAYSNVLTEIDTLPFLTFEPKEVKTKKQMTMPSRKNLRPKKKLNMNLIQFTKIQKDKTSNKLNPSQLNINKMY